MGSVEEVGKGNVDVEISGDSLPLTGAESKVTNQGVTLDNFEGARILTTVLLPWHPKE
jgi:hypothetical protein